MAVRIEFQPSFSDFVGALQVNPHPVTILVGYLVASGMGKQAIHSDLALCEFPREQVLADDPVRLFYFWKTLPLN